MSQKGSTLSLYPSSVTCYNTADATAAANNNSNIMNDHHHNTNHHSSDDDDDDDHDPSSKNGIGGGKSRRELPSGAVATLKAWLLAPEHFTHPYPTPQDQVMLMQKTGIDKKQLKNWFTNARRRIWKPMLKKQLEAGKLAAGVSMTTPGVTASRASLGGVEGGGEGGMPTPELMGSFQQQQQQQQNQRYSQHQQPEPQQEMYNNFQQAQTQQHQVIDPSPSYEQQQQQQQYQQQQVQFLQDIGQMHQQVRENVMLCQVTYVCFLREYTIASFLYDDASILPLCVLPLFCCRKIRNGYTLSLSPFLFKYIFSPSTINMGIKYTRTLPHPINSNIHINKTTNPRLATTTTTTTCTILILRTILIIISPSPIPLDRCHP